MRIRIWDNKTEDFYVDPFTGKIVVWNSYRRAKEWIDQQVQDGESEDRYEVWDDEEI